jgi:predicted nucleic acid-binding protein
MSIEENKERRPLLRVILDTNIYISAALSPKGSSARAWGLARRQCFRLIT